jgi:hypothetical protein
MAIAHVTPVLVCLFSMAASLHTGYFLRKSYFGKGSTAVGFIGVNCTSRSPMVVLLPSFEEKQNQTLIRDTIPNTSRAHYAIKACNSTRCLSINESTGDWIVDEDTDNLEKCSTTFRPIYYDDDDDRTSFNRFKLCALRKSNRKSDKEIAFILGFSDDGKQNNFRVRKTSLCEKAPRGRDVENAFKDRTKTMFIHGQIKHLP